MLPNKLKQRTAPTFPNEILVPKSYISKYSNEKVVFIAVIINYLKLVKFPTVLLPDTKNQDHKNISKACFIVFLAYLQIQNFIYKILLSNVNAIGLATVGASRL